MLGWVGPILYLAGLKLGFFLWQRQYRSLIRRRKVRTLHSTECSFFPGKEVKNKDIRKGGKKAVHACKEGTRVDLFCIFHDASSDSKRSKSSSETIDDIFGALKRPVIPPKDAPKEEDQQQQKSSSSSSPSRPPRGSIDDPLGLGNGGMGDRKRTEEGYKIYTEEELKIGQGGSNNRMDDYCIWVNYSDDQPLDYLIKFSFLILAS